MKPQKTSVKNNATPDKFSIYIKLRHDSSDLAHVSSVLSMKPAYYSVRKRLSVWCTVFAEGSNVRAFSKSLKTLVSFLIRHRTFFHDFISTGGGIEVTLNHYVEIGAFTGYLDADEAPTGLTLFELEL